MKILTFLLAVTLGGLALQAEPTPTPTPTHIPSAGQDNEWLELAIQIQLVNKETIDALKLAWALRSTDYVQSRANLKKRLEEDCVPSCVKADEISARHPELTQFAKTLKLHIQINLLTLQKLPKSLDDPDPDETKTAENKSP